MYQIENKSMVKQLEEGFLPIRRRMRRLRSSNSMRTLVEEVVLRPSHFVSPLFVVEGERQKIPINNMPGVFRLSIDELIKECEHLQNLGIVSVLLFCYVDESLKNDYGSEAYRHGNLLERSVSALKKVFPELIVMVDIALDPYTSHGHDGIVVDGMKIINDPTVQALSKMALIASEAGCDVVAPSDMMDGRIGYMRDVLDKNGFSDVAIISYAAKFASSFYGPFRGALDSAPKFGDKKSYQLNYRNTRESLLECHLDEEEGADMLLIKPALTNLDIIAKVRMQTLLPIAAYQVSGEYAQIMAAAEMGILDKERALIETLTSIKRAGSDFIFTYAAKEVAKLIS